MNYYYEGVKTSPTLDKSKRNDVQSQRSIRFTPQKKPPEDPLLIWRPNFFIHRPPKLLFTKFLNGELSGSDLLSKTNVCSCQSKRNQQDYSPQKQKNKMHVLKHFLTERIKRRSTNPFASKLGETLNDSIKQPIKLCNQQKQLKEQLLLYRLQPQQQQEYYNVNLKARVFDECNQLFNNQSIQKQEESIQQLKKSKKLLFSKLNKAKILSVKPEFTPMNHQNVTIQDVKLFNYLNLSNEANSLETPTSYCTPQYNQHSNNHFRRSCKEQDILKNQKINDTEEVESVSDNRSLQSQYEYHLDDLVQKQKRIEQRYNTSTKRLDHTIKIITKLKQINKEAFFATKSKLKI